MDFTDLAGQYLQTRMDQATQPFTDPEAYLNTRMQNDFGIDMNGNTTPKSTTINYNDDGSRDITHKMTVAPAVPESAPAPAEQMPSAQAPTAPAVPTPVTAVPTANQILSQPPGQGVTIPQTPAQVPPPGQAQMNPAVPTAPVAPPAPGQAQVAQAPAEQLTQPAVPGQPLIAGQATSDVGATPTEQAINQQQQQAPINQPKEVHESNLVSWSDDPRKLQLIATDKRTEAEGGPPDHVKRMANEHLAEYYENERKKNKEIEAAKRMETEGDTRGISKVLSKNESEGSYLKAYLFRRLGMTGLAQQEEAKLGAGSTTQRITMPDGTPAIVRMRADGVASYGVDTKTGKELNADQLALAGASYAKGAETGKAMYKTRDGHTITMTTMPGRVEPVFYDNTEGKILERAPLGITPFGQKDSIIEQALSAKKQIETASRKENNKAGGTQRTEEQIQSLGNNAFKSITGYDYNAREHGVVSPYEEARQAEPTGAQQTQQNLAAGNKAVAGQGEFNDPSINVISAKRPTSQQQDMWDESVAAGRPGRTAAGNPIATPGTSLHETDNARDIDAAKLTKAGRQELAQKGWYQPIPQQDPNHWERMPGYTPKAPEGEKSGIEKNIETQSQAIANYSQKPPTGGGQNAAFNQAVLTRAREINPNFNEQKYAQAIATRKEFTKLTPNSGGGQLQAVNRAVPHLNQFQETVTALNNGKMPAVNSILQQYGYNVGDDKVAAAKSIQALVSNEIQKAVAGGLGGVEERKDLSQQLSTTLNPQQLASVIEQYQGLMAAQAQGLKQNWTSNGLPAKEFDEKLVPKTREVLYKHEQAENNKRSKW